MKQSTPEELKALEKRSTQPGSCKEYHRRVDLMKMASILENKIDPFCLDFILRSLNGP